MGEGRPADDRHLSADELNRYLDHDLSPAERAQLEAHLAACPECRETLADFQALSSLLHELPEIRAPRSFQLGPEYARQPSFWNRLGALLLPMLPAMRAATVALALLLGGVTAYRIVDDQPSTGPVAEQAADESRAPNSTAIMAQAPATLAPTAAEPTSAEFEPEARATEQPAQKTGADSAGAAAPAQSGPAGSQPSSSRSAGSTEMQLPGHSGPSAEAGESSASTGPADNTAMITMDAATPAATASPAAVPTATATSSPAPIPTATATPAPEPAAESGDDSWLGWLQGALAVLLAACGALVVGLSRVRRRLP